ncbi:class I adenylate-forming enzyme family protein [Mycobacterium sp.]|uniref:class I adenylate-forming enzyme family protein n=1 Tax=Mycobacterium sp. TaxID=1785 RepID=UPI002CB7E1B1|nr:class I adenylate-forming enzyme family protein [Mycobacterium sp.]HME49250.1 class I adenylate-forming enzyme family protein [Mycobacterium sp.]
MSANALTVGNVLREQSRDRGDHTLLVCDDERISYAGADRRSAELARALVGLGGGKGTHVGLLFGNGVPFIVGMLAAARIGAVVVPFSTFSTARELEQQLADSDVAILLAAESYRSHDYRARLAEILNEDDYDADGRVFSSIAPQLRRVLFGDAAPAAGVDATMLSALEHDVDGADPVAIIYTSGSTSRPKGVVHTHAALLAHQQNLNSIRGLGPKDTLFCNSPFFWIGGFAFGVLATLAAGATLVCSNATDAGAVLDVIEAEKPNVTNGFPAGVAGLARHPSFARRDLSSVRRGNLYPIMAADARPADPELRHNMLGMTEAGGVLTISGDDTDQPESRRGSFGKPAPGFDTKIIEPDAGRVVERGEIGELCIRGPYVMQRYHRRSREECFDADGWLHTGDLVRADRDGFLYFIGRRGSMIKTAGANVSPAEVEKAIAKVTGGMAAYVVGIPDDQRGQVVGAVIGLDEDVDVDVTSLRHDLEAELSSYKIPKRFAVLRRDTIPLLPSGKVDLAGLVKVFDA